MKLSDIEWGDDSAEKDPFLLEYFVKSLAFQRLQERRKHIVIGRKGAGKSALRKALEEHFAHEKNTHVVNVSPKYNSIKSILNDKDITESFGQEIFFQHTWLRQILLDALCVVGHNAKGQYANGSLEFARNIAKAQDRTSKDLLENVVEMLSRVKAKAGNLGEFGIQIEKELRNVAEVESLEHHFTSLVDSGAQFVVFIDDLDLGWDNSPTANNLLLGLLSALQYLLGKAPIFLCVFLREDVYTILMSKTQHSDKYRNIERVRWDKDSLLNILGRRINYNRTKSGLPIVNDPMNTVFPEVVGASNTGNWLIERTLERPRELIQFARYYTESVYGEEPDVEQLKQAEVAYSSWKLDDLCAEYSNQYPDLVSLFAFWKTKFYRTRYHLRRPEVEDMLLQALSEAEVNASWWHKLAENTDIKGLLDVLYEIGFLGDFVLGGEGGSKTFYSYVEQHVPRFEEVQIHPCFRKSVATVERIRNRNANEAAEKPFS